MVESNIRVRLHEARETKNYGDLPKVITEYKIHSCTVDGREVHVEYFQILEKGRIPFFTLKYVEGGERKEIVRQHPKVRKTELEHEILYEIETQEPRSP